MNPLMEEVGRLDLMGPEAVDASRMQRAEQCGRHPAGPLGRTLRPGRDLDDLRYLPWGRMATECGKELVHHTSVHRAADIA